VGTYVKRARTVVREKINPTLPPGYTIIWSGQFEYMQEAAKRLRVLVPLAVMLVFLLLFIHFGRIADSLIVMLSLLFALVGGIWLMWVPGRLDRLYVDYTGVAVRKGAPMAYMYSPELLA
jgi:Cu(I)/Ag(I) efflux system membrane protein CusA/SilA